MCFVQVLLSIKSKIMHLIFTIIFVLILQGSTWYRKATPCGFHFFSVISGKYKDFPIESVLNCIQIWKPSWISNLAIPSIIWSLGSNFVMWVIDTAQRSNQRWPPEPNICIRFLIELTEINKNYFPEIRWLKELDPHNGTCIWMHLNSFSILHCM
jgi:hypothetical protein